MMMSSGQLTAAAVEVGLSLQQFTDLSIPIPGINDGHNDDVQCSSVVVGSQT